MDYMNIMRLVIIVCCIICFVRIATGNLNNMTGFFGELNEWLKPFIIAIIVAGFLYAVFFWR